MVTCHISVTLDDTVTVIVTSYEIAEKEIEGSGRMILYNMYNTWLFRVGLRSSSTCYSSLVYKVDNLVQSSLSSSLV